MPSPDSQDSSSSSSSSEDSSSSSSRANNDNKKKDDDNKKKDKENKNKDIKNKNNDKNKSKNINKNNDNNKNKNKNGDKSLSAPLPRSSSSSPRALSPPKKASLSSRKPSNSSDKYKINNVIITGAAIGATLFLLLMIVCIVCCCQRKKKKQKHDKNYYENDPNASKDKDYYKQHHQSSDLHLKMPPEPHSGQVSSELGWVAVPPPPPPGMMSSGAMSSSYSGPHQAVLPPPHPSMAYGFNKSSFTYDDLAAATRRFDNSLLLGQGGFGYVHKGVLPNGKEIAVKSLKDGSGQGDREFQAEVDIISRVHHRHLVSLVGYCITGQQRMLVYEFISNKTLEYHLHGEGRPVMEFSTRLRIALGAAKGFAYLHEDCDPHIIHRDIKAANILINDHYEAKVADFGLAKLSSDTITHVSTRIMGTFGYLAPEYASTGKLTDKSDVYSYGVVLLELITGRRPIIMDSDDDGLIDWARPILMRASDGGSFEELLDPRLEDKYDRDEMHRMVACAAACIRHSARRRPKMSQIVRVLEGDVSLDDLNEVGKNTQNTT